MIINGWFWETEKMNRIENFLNLSDEDMDMVMALSEKIDVCDVELLRRYGVACQKKFSNFSDNVWNKIKVRDFEQIGKIMNELLGELSQLCERTKRSKRIFGFRKKTKKQGNQLVQSYKYVLGKIEVLTGKLEAYQNQLLKDVVMLDEAYKMNLRHLKELTMYIIAGQKILEKEVATLELKNNFEKRIHDLELSRTISMQMAPQILFVQKNSNQMIDKIQFLLHETIPVWRNQMNLICSMEDTKEVMNFAYDTNERLMHTLDEIVQLQKKGCE